MLAPWKKSYDQPRQHIKKQRHCFANKGLSSQSYGFFSSHIWVWGWTIKKAEHWRIDAFEIWCRRLLRVLWIARRSNQSTWVWAGSGIWWWTWKPGVLQFMGSQRFGHDCATELIWLVYGDSNGEWRLDAYSELSIFSWVSGNLSPVGFSEASPWVVEPNLGTALGR